MMYRILLFMVKGMLAIFKLKFKLIAVAQAWAAYSPRVGPAREAILTGPQTVSDISH